jgi:hypothetical protein
MPRDHGGSGRFTSLVGPSRISLPRSKQVGFGEGQTSNGSRNPQSRSKMTHSGPSKMGDLDTLFRAYQARFNE